MVERTFVMVKPDGVGRRLVGELMGRYENKGLKLIGLKMQIMSADVAQTHYQEHSERPFFGDLVDFITSGPTVQMVWEGESAVEAVRKMNGATNCLAADLGTIRGDYGLTTQNNMVHASDSPETAEREIRLYFSEDELWEYSMPDEHWLT